MLTDMRTIGGGATLIAALCLVAACATRAPVLVAPAAPAYPEFLYPAIPAALSGTEAAGRVERGWQDLQADRLDASQREFTAALRTDPRFYPALAGQGYVAVARKDWLHAVAAFEAAMAVAPDYAPALAGSGQAFAALGRDADAVAAYEAAVRADPGHPELRRRLDVVRFRQVQALIARARGQAAAGHFDEARQAYERALAATPESAFLHRELADVERRGGDLDAALAQYRRAVAIDASDAAAWLAIGDILDVRRDFDGAVAAYERARRAEPSIDGVGDRLARARASAREMRQPPELRAVPAAAEITRADLAAIVGTRLAALVDRAPVRRVVVTDIRGSWAAAWIDIVLASGIMDAYDNHTFRPRARVRRSDLAVVVSRLLRILAADQPAARAALVARPAVADVSRTHLAYPSVAAAVASGVMPLEDAGRFHLTQTVSGAEALQVIDRLRALTDPSR